MAGLLSKRVCLGRTVDLLDVQRIPGEPGHSRTSA